MSLVSLLFFELLIDLRCSGLFPTSDSTTIEELVLEAVLNFAQIVASITQCRLMQVIS